MFVLAFNDLVLLKLTFILLVKNKIDLVYIQFNITSTNNKQLEGERDIYMYNNYINIIYIYIIYIYYTPIIH